MHLCNCYSITNVGYPLFRQSQTVSDLWFCHMLSLKCCHPSQLSSSPTQVRTSKLAAFVFSCCVRIVGMCVHLSVCCNLWCPGGVSRTGTLWVVCLLRNQTECADTAPTEGVMDPALTWDDGGSSEEGFKLSLFVKLTQATAGRPVPDTYTPAKRHAKGQQWNCQINYAAG